MQEIKRADLISFFSDGAETDLNSNLFALTLDKRAICKRKEFKGETEKGDFGHKALCDPAIFRGQRI